MFNFLLKIIPIFIADPKYPGLYCISPGSYLKSVLLPSKESEERCSL